MKIFVRPRSLSRLETHLLIDGKPICGTLFDIITYAYHNAYTLSSNYNQSCYFYLSKIDSLEEAIFYNKVLDELESQLRVPQYSFKVNIIVESIYILLELEEIIFAFKHRIVGLNTGRWNYMASILHSYSKDLTSLIKPRMKISHNEPFLEAFNRHVVHLAHKRGIHAIGGASNYIPSSNSAKATEIAKKYVIEEKFREAN